MGPTGSKPNAGLGSSSAFAPHSAPSRHCDWAHCANSTRMMLHYTTKHVSEPLPAAANEASSSRVARQETLLRYTDAAFCQRRQSLSLQSLALLKVCANIPYSALESPAMQAFVKSLRSDFQLPSRRTLQRHVSSLYLEVRLALGEQFPLR